MKLITVKLEILARDNYEPNVDILDDLDDRYSPVSIHSLEIIKTENVEL